MSREAGPTNARLVVPIRDESDVMMARRHARELARRESFAQTAIEELATAVSEIARNIVVHAGAGEVVLEIVREPTRSGLLVVARDDGPGKPDREQALRDGY